MNDIIGKNCRDNEELPRVLSSKKLRRGKWDENEEEYTTKIISLFRRGLLNLEPGATLRQYLSSALNCDPMRITKKFAGEQCIGKCSFLPAQVNSWEIAMALDDAQNEILKAKKQWYHKLFEQESELGKSKTRRHGILTKKEALMCDALSPFIINNDLNDILSWHKKSLIASKEAIDADELDSLIKDGEHIMDLIKGNIKQVFSPSSPLSASSSSTTLSNGNQPFIDSTQHDIFQNNDYLSDYNYSSPFLKNPNGGMHSNTGWTTRWMASSYTTNTYVSVPTCSNSYSNSTKCPSVTSMDLPYPSLAGPMSHPRHPMDNMRANPPPFPYSRSTYPDQMPPPNFNNTMYHHRDSTPAAFFPPTNMNFPCYPMMHIYDPNIRPNNHNLYNKMSGVSRNYSEMEMDMDHQLPYGYYPPPPPFPAPLTSMTDVNVGINGVKRRRYEDRMSYSDPNTTDQPSDSYSYPYSSNTNDNGNHNPMFLHNHPSSQMNLSHQEDRKFLHLSQNYSHNNDNNSNENYHYQQPPSQRNNHNNNNHHSVAATPSHQYYNQYDSNHHYTDSGNCSSSSNGSSSSGNTTSSSSLSDNNNATSRDHTSSISSLSMNTTQCSSGSGTSTSSGSNQEESMEEEGEGEGEGEESTSSSDDKEQAPPQPFHTTPRKTATATSTSSYTYRSNGGAPYSTSSSSKINGPFITADHKRKRPKDHQPLSHPPSNVSAATTLPASKSEKKKRGGGGVDIGDSEEFDILSAMLSLNNKKAYI